MSDDTTKLAVPDIHLNGTSRESLCKALEEAANAVFHAREKLMLTAPHARDYYTQPDSVWQQAVAEHNLRAKKLAEVQEELFQVWNAIAPQ